MKKSIALTFEGLNMATKQLFSVKILTLAAISHLALGNASVATDAPELETVIATSLPQQEVELVKAADVPQSAEQKLEDLKADTTTKVNYLDSAIKYGLVAGGVALGAAATYFYGPALAATAAYEGSLALANYMMPHQGLATYYLVTHPAAINAGMQFANSSIVQGVLGTTSSVLGYGLGKLGCGLYEGLKYVAKTAGSVTYDTAAYLAKHGCDAGSSIGSTVLSGAQSATSSAWSWLGY